MYFIHTYNNFISVMGNKTYRIVICVCFFSFHKTGYPYKYIGCLGDLYYYKNSRGLVTRFVKRRS